jgi:hypothetical protein
VTSSHCSKHRVTLTLAPGRTIGWLTDRDRSTGACVAPTGALTGTPCRTASLAVLITVGMLGICYPFALVPRERWRAKHPFIDGYPLVFTGSTTALFGDWIKWFLLGIITLASTCLGWARGSPAGSASTPTSTAAGRRFH